MHRLLPPIGYSVNFRIARANVAAAARRGNRAAAIRRTAV